MEGMDFEPSLVVENGGVSLYISTRTIKSNTK